MGLAAFISCVVTLLFFILVSNVKKLTEKLWPYQVLLFLVLTTTVLSYCDNSIFNGIIWTVYTLISIGIVVVKKAEIRTRRALHETLEDLNRDFDNISDLLDEVLANRKPKGIKPKKYVKKLKL